jgi:hypothetical protein
MHNKTSEGILKESKIFPIEVVGQDLFALAHRMKYSAAFILGL